MTRNALLAAATTASVLLAGCTGAQDDPPVRSGEVAATSTPPRASDGPVPDASTWTPEPAPAGEPGTPRGLELPDQVDATDPLAVAEAYTATVLSYDTAIDASPVDASRRAAQWATPELGATISAERAGRGGADWTTLAESNGYLSVAFTTHPAVEDGLVTTEPDQLATDVPQIVTVTAHDADLPEQQFSVLVGLTRNHPDEPWLVYDWILEAS